MGGIDTFVTDAARIALTRKGKRKEIYRFWKGMCEWFDGFGTPSGLQIVNGEVVRFDGIGCPILDGLSWRYLEPHHKEQVAQMWLNWRAS